MLRRLKRKPENPVAETEEVLEQDIESQSSKRSRTVTVTPGELRLQKDIESLDDHLRHYLTIERHEEDNQRITLRYLVDKELQDKVPNHFELIVRRFYPHDRPLIRCLDEGFACSYILENGNVIHSSLTSGWTAVCGLGEIVERVQEIRQIFQMLNDPHRVESIDAQALQTFMTVPTSPTVYSPHRQNAELQRAQSQLNSQASQEEMDDGLNIEVTGNVNDEENSSYSNVGNLYNSSPEKHKRCRDVDLIAECYEEHVGKYAHLHYDDAYQDHTSLGVTGQGGDGSDGQNEQEKEAENSLIDMDQDQDPTSPSRDIALLRGHGSNQGVLTDERGHHNPNSDPNPNPNHTIDAISLARDIDNGRTTHVYQKEEDEYGIEYTFRGIDNFLHPQETRIARPFVVGLHNTMQHRDELQPMMHRRERVHHRQRHGGGMGMSGSSNGSEKHVEHDANSATSHIGDSDEEKGVVFGHHGGFVDDDDDTERHYKESDCLTEREGDSDCEMDPVFSAKQSHSHSNELWSEEGAMGGSEWGAGYVMMEEHRHPSHSRSLSEGQICSQAEGAYGAFLGWNHAPSDQQQPQWNPPYTANGGSHQGVFPFQQQQQQQQQSQTLFPQQQYRSRP